ncbi:hypothetical protein Ocin01_08527 [Orchesella cincta]|uniref:Uncharacterized protein n=1 Tax=Orchesella cincta TaxID=48709 RepID=A0A1D2MZB4_ORCCI|nr:hypothetical protein Ocin01_08527 [Orchesella cincta]
MKYAFLILCFVCACTLVWNVKASPMSTATESHMEESNGRVRRDMEGLMSMMTGKPGADGKPNPFADIFKFISQGIQTITQAFKS